MHTSSLKALIGRVGPALRDALEAAAALAQGKSHYDLDIEHALVGMLDQSANDFSLILDRFDVDRERLRGDLSEALESLRTGNPRIPAFGPSLAKLLEQSWLIASLEFAASEVRTGHVMLAMMRDHELRRMLHDVTDELDKISDQSLTAEYASISAESPEAGEAPVVAEPRHVASSHMPDEVEKDVFLSYARTDHAMAESIVSALEADDLSVWFDLRIPAGRTFSAVIESALEACRCVVVLWSRASVDSEWVQEEAHRGKERDILVPALIESVRPPMGFSLIQAADLVGWGGDAEHPAFRGFADDIKRLVH